jgi:uncharacterized DUF497 family protein
MDITYDLAKNAKNIHERNLPFDRVADLNWATATFKEDVRKEYPERRFVALAYMEKRLHVLCFAETKSGIRVISFRKANRREERDYEKNINANK